MNFSVINKDEDSDPVKPNLLCYEDCYKNFNWDSANTSVDGLPDGGINIAYEAVDRHLLHVQGDKTAIQWLGKAGGQQTLSYRELSEPTSRFASLLQRLGVGKGDRVFGLAGRTPALYFALLGSLKNSSVFAPLFSAFGPEPVRARMKISDARVLVTTQRIYRK